MDSEKIFSLKSCETIAQELGLPQNSTRRLIELKLAKAEIESRNREIIAGEIELLEKELKDATENYLKVKDVIDKDVRERVSRKRIMLSQQRDIDFYRDKVRQLNPERLDRKQKELESEAVKIRGKREILNGILKELEKFDGIEPTNEALRRKIDDLKTSRLSLDMTFVDYS